MKKFLILALLTGLTAFKKEAPDCNDDRVKALLTDIIHESIMEEMEERYFPSSQRPYVTKEELQISLSNIRKELYRNLPALDRSVTTYKVENIRTVSLDKETGTYKCKGAVSTYDKAGVRIGSTDIIYMSELADGGKNFYVSFKMDH